MRFRFQAAAAAAAALLALATPTRAGSAAADLYSGFVLIDPATGTRSADAWLVVRDGRIERTGTGALPRGEFRHHDMRGLYGMPGLIDAHAHIIAGPQRVSVVEGRPQIEITSGDAFSQSNAAIALAFGVTSVRNPGGSTVAAARYDAMIGAGEWVGPEARHAGEILEPAPFVGESFAHPATPEEWEAEAARQAASGMTYFKLYTDLKAEELALGVQAARSHGLIPIAHLNEVSWTRALELGVQQFEHALPTSPDLLEPAAREQFAVKPDLMILWWELADLDGPLIRDLVASLAKADAKVDLTLVVNEMAYFGDEWETRLPELAHPADYFHPGQLKGLEAAYAAFRGAPASQLARGKAVWPKVLAFAKMLHDAGVDLMIGTDGAGGVGLHHELENHVQAGIPAWEVLRMATSGNAEHIGLGQTGRLAAGYEADIVFLGSDPVADVGNVRDVAFVVTNGTLYRHEDLLDVARQIAVAASPAPGEAP